MPVRQSLTGIFLFLLCVAAAAHNNHAKKTSQKPQVLAPGYQSLSFDAPTAGSYTLPVIATAGGGQILSMSGKPEPLLKFFGDKYVVLSFIYTHCDDINGCPLATYVTSRVQNRLIAEKDLQDQVRFISLSFDPVNDTPDVMAKYGDNFRKEGFDWQFLTTRSDAELSPILSNYSQSILKDIDENGNETGSISHVLRVFLVDKQNQIRNIYSTSFLHPDTVVNDIKTLALETAQNANAKKPGKNTMSGLHGAGDNKDGYESAQYKTDALSLQTRLGTQANLKNNIANPPLGLPKFSDDIVSSTSQAKIQLGRQLFYDRRLSHNNTFSCAMCHIPEQGFSSNELSTAVGIEGRTVRRNTPTIYNVGYADILFHDGREDELEQQIWGPLLAHNEMGNPSIGYVINKLKSIEEYIQKFGIAFNGQIPNMLNIGEAFAAYERTLVSANSNFDRWFLNNEPHSMNQKAKAGYKLFSGKAQCTSCHTVNESNTLFTDQQLHNTGVGFLNSMKTRLKTRKILVAPGTWLEVDSKDIANSSETKPNDLGYYEISGAPDDRWKYKTPSLRNIALTAPYMHNGSLSNLQQVVEFYNAGGIKNELLDPLIHPLNLSTEEMSNLVIFLENLTGDNVDELISDAFAVPVGNTN
jgi:cytochrome c peroxidase